ncbi:carbohydrate kinase family protein [Candidatus Omnitrophota bacterium]
MSIDVLFLGGTSIDLIQDKRKKGGRRPVFAASTGGSITNSAVIGAKLGLKAAMLSRIGKDPLGDFAVRFLTSCGVNTKGIIQDPVIRTPLAIANIDRSGDSIYTFYKNPPKQSIVPLKGVPKYLLKNCKIFHFGSSFSYQKETSIEVLKFVKFLKKRGTFISFDPNLRPYAIKDKIGAKKRVLDLLKWVDMAKLSEIDLGFLTGQKDPLRGLEKLKKLTPCEVILTLGPKGSIYLDSKERFIKIPAFRVKIADTIGAGDAFTAGLLYKLNKIGGRAFFNNIRPHLIFASAVSAIICTNKGANQALKNLKQVKNFLSKLT